MLCWRVVFVEGRSWRNRSKSAVYTASGVTQSHVLNKVTKSRNMHASSEACGSSQRSVDYRLVMTDPGIS